MTEDGSGPASMGRLSKQAEEINDTEPEEETSADAQTSEPEPTDSAPADADDVRPDDEETGKVQPVRDRAAEYNLYMPEWQNPKWKRAVHTLQGIYMEEYTDDLDKLRHCYPIIIQYGYDNVDDLSPEDIHKLKQKIEEKDRVDA